MKGRAYVYSSINLCLCLISFALQSAFASRYGALLRRRPVAHLLRGEDLTGAAGSTDNLSPCSMLLVHAGAFNWMLDAVEELGRSSSQAGRADGEGGPRRSDDAESEEVGPKTAELDPQLHIDVWNEAARLGLSGGCVGKACGPSHTSQAAAGAPLAARLLGGEGLLWSRELSLPRGGFGKRVCEEVKRLVGGVPRALFLVSSPPPSCERKSVCCCLFPLRACD